MPVVRLPDGSLAIDHGNGKPLPWVMGEGALTNMGLQVPPPLTDPSRGALAQNDPRFGASYFDVAPTRADVQSAPMAPVKRSSPADIAKQQADLQATSARLQDEARAREGGGAPAAPHLTPEQRYANAGPQPGAPKPAGEEETKKPELKGGARVVSMPDQPSGAPRAGGGGYGPRLIKGGDIRAGFQVARSNLNPDDIQAAEDAEADASIDEKLAAQQLSDTSAQRSTALAQRLGEQLDAEDLAVAHQADKNQAIEAEYNRRQGEIDAENDAIDKMPIQGAAEILGDRSAFSKFLSGISIALGGAMQGAGFTKDNVGLQMRDKAVNDAIMAQQAKRDARRQGLHVRETQLERLEKLYGDPKAAESELRDRMDRLFDRHAYQMALDSGATDAAAQLQAEFAKKDAARAQAKLERQQALAGKITESFVNRPDMVIGVPRVNEDDVQQLAEERRKAGLLEDEGESGNLHDLIAQVPGNGEIPTDMTRGILNKAGRSVIDLFGGQGAASNAIDTPTERSASQKLSRAQAALFHKLSGAAVSETEAKRIEAGIYAANTRQGLLEQAAEIDAAKARKDASVKAGFKPDVVDTFEQRQRQRAPRPHPSSSRGD